MKVCISGFGQIELEEKQGGTQTEKKKIYLQMKGVMGLRVLLSCVERSGDADIARADSGVTLPG